MYYIDYWQESVELAETESPGSLWVCLALDPSLSDAMILWPFVQVGKVVCVCMCVSLLQQCRSLLGGQYL